MATPKTSTLPACSSFESKQQEHQTPRYILKWRQKQLLVSLAAQNTYLELPATETQQWLVECLKRSSVKLIKLDVALGVANLKSWADASEQANKAVFLRLPAKLMLPKQQRSFVWWLKRLIDWSFATLLMITLSPVILGLLCIMWMRSPQPVFCQQWCVDDRGRMFKLYGWCTTTAKVRALKPNLISERTNNLQKYQDVAHIPAVEHWIYKYGLNKLPQLLNVLRGDISLVKARFWTLDKIVQLSVEKLQPMQSVPEINQV